MLSYPVEHELLLIGGGHAHVAILKHFGMHPLPGVRLTLVSPQVLTPYSGMIPGYLAGHYNLHEAHLDLRRLCHFGGTQFYQDKVIRLDLEQRKAHCLHRPPIAFDLVSIDIGSTPDRQSVPGALEHALPIKPIHRFLERWEALENQIHASSAPQRIVIVGTGAGGIEVALSLQHRIQKKSTRHSVQNQARFTLIGQSPEILSTHNRAVSRHFKKLLKDRNIETHLGQAVQEVLPQQVILQDKTSVPYDILIWATHAAAAPWFAESGLNTDSRGFIELLPTLQSTSHPFVFAAGDCATQRDHPRPKAGVFAVRQGPPLAQNLRRYLQNLPLKPHIPQKAFLSILGTGTPYAVASRGPFKIAGNWVWKWKDYIDRRWMKQYQDLPSMQTRHGSPSGPPRMRCAGCGSKIGPALLQDVLQALPLPSSPSVILGMDNPDDAAAYRPTPNALQVQTVDSFRSFISDPYLFGRLALLHALSDLFAMGATPTSVQTLITVPYGSESAMRETLFQAMSGLAQELQAHQLPLLGGHSTEGPDLVLGLVVNGEADPAHLLRKSGMEPGDRLILTKPLGIGLLLAANAQGVLPGDVLDQVLPIWLTSNQTASQILRDHGARAMTDITGFGLLGHLLEMCQASRQSVEIQLSDIPLYPQVDHLSRQNIASSLLPSILRHVTPHLQHTLSPSDPAFKWLGDPQTAGGLLTSIPLERSNQCLKALHDSGILSARDIGTVHSPPLKHPIRLR